MSCLIATVDGFSLVDRRPDGTDIHVTGTPGWNEGGDIDFRQVARGTSHGTFNTPVYARQIDFSIQGLATSPTHLASEQLERQMTAILAGGETGVVAMQHAGDVALWVNAHRSARVSIERFTPRKFKWRIPLLAPDSFRYGDDSTGSTPFATDPEGAGLVFDLFAPDGVLDFGTIPTSDGTVTVVNEGSAPAYPVFTIDGPGPVGGFSIVDVGTSQRVTYLGALPSGSSLVIDARDASALLNGTADRSGELVATQWPVVAPGEQATYRFAPEVSTSAAVMTVTLTSTYW